MNEFYFDFQIEGENPYSFMLKSNVYLEGPECFSEAFKMGLFRDIEDVGHCRIFYTGDTNIIEKHKLNNTLYEFCS